MKVLFCRSSLCARREYHLVPAGMEAQALLMAANKLQDVITNADTTDGRDRPCTDVQPLGIRQHILN
jgi:hypothetical protein